MKKLFLTLIIVIGLASGLYAQDAIKNGITPYGDYCTCRDYGICRKQLRHKEAVSAIHAYFKGRGLKVKDIKSRGRFIKADIYRNDKLVDRIIFDRKTGRLRSIY